MILFSEYIILVAATRIKWYRYHVKAFWLKKAVLSIL